VGEGLAAARLWDAATGQPLGSPLAHPRMILTAVFSPDGKAVLTGGGNAVTGEALLWAMGGGLPPGSPLPHPGAVEVVAFSPDGRTALTAGTDKTARLWDAATG